MELHSMSIIDCSKSKMVCVLSVAKKIVEAVAYLWITATRQTE